MSLLQQIARKLGSSLECRRMELGDRLPEEFRLNVPCVDKEWTWVAEERGKITAAVFAGPYHGAVFIGNVFALKSPKVIIGLLLRQVIRDCRDRGYQAYFTFLEQGRIEETKLLSILHRANGTIHDKPMTLVGGKLDDLARF